MYHRLTKLPWLVRLADATLPWFVRIYFFPFKSQNGPCLKLSGWLTNVAFIAHSKPRGLATAVGAKTSLGFVVSPCPPKRTPSPAIEASRGKTRNLFTPPPPPPRSPPLYHRGVYRDAKSKGDDDKPRKLVSLRTLMALRPFTPG